MYIVLDQLVDKNWGSCFWYIYIRSNLCVWYSLRILYTDRNVTDVCVFPQLLPENKLIIHYHPQISRNYKISSAHLFIRLLNISQLFNSNQTVQGFPLEVLRFRCKYVQYLIIF
jgi:hypothetical protein